MIKNRNQLDNIIEDNSEHIQGQNIEASKGGISKLRSAVNKIKILSNTNKKEPIIESKEYNDVSSI